MGATESQSSRDEPSFAALIRARRSVQAGASWGEWGRAFSVVISAPQLKPLHAANVTLLTPGAHEIVGDAAIPTHPR